MGACFSKHSHRTNEELDNSTIATTTAAAAAAATRRATDNPSTVEVVPSDLKHAWRASNPDQKKNEAITASPARNPTLDPNPNSSSSSISVPIKSERQKQCRYGLIRKASSPSEPTRSNALSFTDRRKASRVIKDEEDEDEQEGITDGDGDDAEEEEEEEEVKDCKFPSFARKQWLLQQAESLKKSSSSSSSSLIAQVAVKAEMQASSRPGYGGEETLVSQDYVQKSSSLTGKKKQRYSSSSSHQMDHQSSDLASVAIATTPERKTMQKKVTSSLPSPSPAAVEASSVSNQQRYPSPSSPLKRVQSVRDNHHHQQQHFHHGSPQFSKNPSLRGSLSPNRRNQEAMKARASSPILSSDPYHQNSNNLSSSSLIHASSASHRRIPSGDNAELAPPTEGYVRKPSPPKKSSVLAVPPLSSSSSSSASVAVLKRQNNQAKVSTGHESFTLSSSAAAAAASIAITSRKGIVSSTIAGSGEGIRRRENSPLRRTSSVNRIVDGSMEHSITSDIGHLDLVKEGEERGKDRSRKPYSSNRTPLREIQQASERDNTSSLKSSNLLKPKGKLFGPMSKPSDRNMTINELKFADDAVREHRDEGGDRSHEDNESLELKAEKLVKGGKSVLSAFKALEEYRSNHQHRSVVPGSETPANNKKDDDKDGDENDLKYMRKQPCLSPKEPFSSSSIHQQNQYKQHQNQPQKPNHQANRTMQQSPNHQVKRTMQQSPNLQVNCAMQQGANHQANRATPQQSPTHHPLLMKDDAEAGTQSLFIKNENGNPVASPIKRSCEPFVFPDVQSGVLNLTIPPSVSKACSILKAVADLNMGGGGSLSMYAKETRDEFEKPNLSSFQFE